MRSTESLQKTENKLFDDFMKLVAETNIFTDLTLKNVLNYILYLEKENRGLKERLDGERKRGS